MEDELQKYITKQGGHLLEPTNPFEIARFKANKEVCVIYKGKRGYSFSSPLAEEVFVGCCDKNDHLFLNREKRKQIPQNLKRELFKRDGNKCFYTGIDLTEDTASIEHLIPVCKGGKNNLDNLVLCLPEENAKMGNLPLIEKIKYRESNLFTTKGAINHDTGK